MNCKLKRVSNIVPRALIIVLGVCETFYYTFGHSAILPFLGGCKEALQIQDTKSLQTCTNLHLSLLHIVILHYSLHYSLFHDLLCPRHSLPETTNESWPYGAGFETCVNHYGLVYYIIVV